MCPPYTFQCVSLRDRLRAHKRQDCCLKTECRVSESHEGLHIKIGNRELPSPAVVGPGCAIAKACNASGVVGSTRRPQATPRPPRSAPTTRRRVSGQYSHFLDAKPPARDAATTVLLDVRNGYESQVGRFAGATDPRTRNFSQLPAWCAAHAERLRAADAVYIYCTGGIRCEKARELLLSDAIGAPRVYQLRGGILRLVVARSKRLVA